MNEINADIQNIAKLPFMEQHIQLAALISNEFQKMNVCATVVGGSAVQLYTATEYTTKDLDMVLTGDSKDSIEIVMSHLGFVRASTIRHFEHVSLPFVIEFPSSPLAVGNRQIESVNIIECPQGAVRILRIEDILMDRLIAAVEWKSPKHMEQAKLLWIKNKKLIDLKYLKQFAKSEGYQDEIKKICK